MKNQRKFLRGLHGMILGLCSSLLAPGLPAATLIWTNLAGGDWNAAANWRPNQVPGGSDSAWITNGGTYTVSLANAADVVSNLVVGGVTGTQTLTMTYTLTINGQATVRGNGMLLDHLDSFQSSWGTLAGPGSLTVQGQMNWQGGGLTLPAITNLGMVSLAYGTFNGCDFVNAGQLLVTSTYTFSGGSVLSNTPAGVVTSTSYANFDYSWDPAFEGTGGQIVNAGQLIISYPNQEYGSGNTSGPWYGYSQVPLINTGTLVITNASNFSLSGGGTNLGEILIGAGSTLTCSNQFEFSPGLVTGAGGLVNEYSGLDLDGTIACAVFRDDQSVVTRVTGALNATNSTFDGVTIFTNSGSLEGSIYVRFGSMYCEGNGRLQPAAITLINPIYGTNPVVATGPITWTGITGDIYDSVTVNGGTVDVASSCAITGGGALINTGVLNWTPSSGPRTGGGSVISNTPSGVINAVFNGNALDNYVYGGAAVFANAGQLNLSGTGQSGALTGPFLNTGTVNINSGTLDLNGGGTNGGSITLAAATTLAVNNLYTFGNGSTVTGTGTNLLAGGTINYLGNAAVGNNIVWWMNGGTVNLAGSGALTPAMVYLTGGTEQGPGLLATPGPLIWTNGGSLNGTVTANGGLVNVSAGSSLAGGDWINTGALTWIPNSGPRTGNSSVISNAPSGAITAVFNGNSLDNFVYGGNELFANAGTLNLSGPGQSGAFIGPFQNTGSVNLNSGTLDLNGGGTNNAIVAVAGGATLAVNYDYAFANNSVISGTGTNLLAGGTVAFLGGASVGNGIVWWLTGGTVNLDGAGPLTPAMVLLTGGTLQGPGSLATPGPLIWTNGGNLNGALTANGGLVNVPAGSSLAGGDWINTGALTWIPNSGPRTGNGSVISNAPSGAITAVFNGNSLDNFVYGGNELFANAGTLNLSGPGQSGAFSGPFQNSGSVNINSGTLDLNGGGSLGTGTLGFSLASTTDFGALNTAGSLPLAGSHLKVTLNGYQPAIGDAFNLINYASETGAFATTALPPNGVWQTAYDPTAFYLTVTGLTIDPTNITLNVIQPPLTPQGFNFQVVGPYGSNYVVQVSTNLHTGGWLAITNFTSSAYNTPVVDPGATNLYPPRFYRAYSH